MEPVLLGLAAPSAINEAGNLLERTLRAAAGPFAAVLHAVAAAVAPHAEASDSANVSIDDLKTYSANLHTNIAHRIEQTLASAGVELDEPIALRISDIDGRVEVVGDHPQKALIESALADDDELIGQFAEMIALRQLLAAGHETGDEDVDAVQLGQADQIAALVIFSTDVEGPKLEFN